MKSRLFLLPFLFLFLLSCKRKSIVYLPTSIIIGNIDGMEIKTIDSTITGVPFAPGSLNLDVNNDGKMDIQYNISFGGSPGSGYAGIHTLNILNSNISLGVYSYYDTTFFRNDTVYDSTIGLYAYMNKLYFFTRHTSADSVVSLNNYPFKTKILEKENKLNQADQFRSQQTYLMNYSYDHKTVIKQTKDTTYVLVYNENINKNPYPLNKEIYFGFRINDNGVSRLGWLRFMIIADADAKIIETAIQKN